MVILRYAKDDGEHNELQILSLLAGDRSANRHIPEIYGVCYTAEATSIVQELAIWGALKVALKNPELAPRITNAHKLRCTIQLAQGMAFLESNRCVHADLSCRNVLLFALEDNAAETIVKLTDFGLSVILQEGTDHECRKQPQATRWCAPETIAHMKLSHASDVWALGATLWELFNAATAPWVRREKRTEVAARLRDLAENNGIAEGGPDVSQDFPQAAGCPDNVHSLVLQCLQVDEYSRPTFSLLSSRLARALEEGNSVPSDVDSKANGQPAAKAPTPSTVAPPSRDQTPARVEQEPAVEAAAQERPWSCEADGRAPMDDERDSHAAHFKAIRFFLRSQLAAESLPDEALLAMWQEVDEAQAREAYLMDLVRRMQAVANESSEVVEMLEESMPKSPAGVYLTPSRRGLPPPPPAFSGSAAMLSGAPSHDHLVPLTPAGGNMIDCACPLPPHDGMWTLWSFIGPALRRQDFVIEADAWAAFDANKAQPCMLRDPSGAEVAARAWVSSYFKLVPRVGSMALPQPLRQGSPQPQAPIRPPSRSRASHALPAWQ